MGSSNQEKEPGGQEENNELGLQVLMKDLRQRNVKLDENLSRLDVLAVVAELVSAKEKLMEAASKREECGRQLVVASNLPQQNNTKKPVKPRGFRLFGAHISPDEGDTEKPNQESIKIVIKPPVCNKPLAGRGNQYEKGECSYSSADGWDKINLLAFGDIAKEIRHYHEGGLEISSCSSKKAANGPTYNAKRKGDVKDAHATSKNHKKIKINKNPVVLPNPPPELPPRFRSRIEEMTGSAVEDVHLALLIQKELTNTDMMPNQSRLSLQKRIVGDAFLTEHEKSLLGKDKPGFEVKVIEPTLGVSVVDFQLWNIGSGLGYVLKKTWNDMKRRNDLQVDDVIQVWSFRMPASGELCLAIVKL
ncbi:hypothetical protein Tsubulata_040167 [Turnera subulata]|uniref:TF-B3 domain-containing protein n=1 Tax=Turnera subulata TaxID=218843 RepID=A0A9Q0F6T7_9ROSI|nr:hypothetical protein Tsubulata_040167 [Turnera subulata]